MKKVFNLLILIVAVMPVTAFAQDEDYFSPPIARSFNDGLAESSLREETLTEEVSTTTEEVFTEEELQVVTEPINQEVKIETVEVIEVADASGNAEVETLGAEETASNESPVEETVAKETVAKETVTEQIAAVAHQPIDESIDEDAMAQPDESLGDDGETASAGEVTEVADQEPMKLEPPAPEEVPLDFPLYRQRPGQEPKPHRYPSFIYEAVPDINSSASDFSDVHNRWNMLYTGKWYDPYNQNLLKGDLPIFGADTAHPYFLEITAISDTVVEGRKIPIPVGGASTNNPESTDTFGNERQFVASQTFIFSLSFYNGNTSFKPQEFEFRVTPAINYNFVDGEEDGVLRVDPARGDNRDDAFIGFNELFAELHLANISERYDFISSRFGIQQFSSDFRGFIYNDYAPGVRLFGNYDDNKYQYNLAWFNRLDKDTNSGLNTFENRYEQVVIANLYRQDAPVLGHTMQASVVYRDDRAGSHGDDYDNNGFLVRPAAIGDERPKNVYSTYFGLNADGHFGRINDTFSAYYVTGSESHNPIAEQQVNINAFMIATELSYDIDWIRIRGSFFWASGDRDPFDDEGEGFSAIFDNPNFAGGDLAFWQREGIPLIGGGGVNLVNPASFLPDLRAGKQEGQANFVNPGLRLFNLGVDVEVTPKIKWINNLSYLQFDQPDALKAVRQDGSIDRDIGFDLSSGVIWRPFLNNNVQVRFGGAILFPLEGAENLFKNETMYHMFSNLILLY